MLAYSNTGEIADPIGGGVCPVKIAPLLHKVVLSELFGGPLAKQLV